MASSTQNRPPPAVEEKIKEYKATEAEVQTLFSQKQTILSQLNENTLVHGELGMIHEDNPKIYKLVGPVLVPVDFEEAKQNVNKRLEFIEQEIKKVESLIDGKQNELNEKATQIQQIQHKMQADAALAARAIATDLTAS